MVALIEDQIHQFLIEQEKKRCKALEEKYNAAIRLLMHAGARQREVLGAGWDQVDIKRGFLSFAKSKAIPLNRAALDALDTLPHTKGNNRIFPEAKWNEGIKGMEVTPKTIPKPWTRPDEFSLCQEVDLLTMVDKYDYDLSDKMFKNYCSERGLLHVAGKPGSKRWKYLADYRKTKSNYLAESHFQFAEEIGGKKYRYTNEEMETGWKIIQLGRAKLQDCWELYSRESSDTN